MQNGRLGLGRADHTLSIRVWRVGEKVQAKRAKKRSCVSRLCHKSACFVAATYKFFQPTCAVTDPLLERG